MDKHPAAEWFDENIGLDAEKVDLLGLWKAMEGERVGQYITVGRRDDDSQTGVLHVSIAHGDVFVKATIEIPEIEEGFTPSHLRFRSHFGGGKSLRVRIALFLLVVAMAADEAERAG